MWNWPIPPQTCCNDSRTVLTIQILLWGGERRQVKRGPSSRYRVGTVRQAEVGVGGGVGGWTFTVKLWKIFIFTHLQITVATWEPTHLVMFQTASGPKPAFLYSENTGPIIHRVLKPLPPPTTPPLLTCSGTHDEDLVHHPLYGAQVLLPHVAPIGAPEGHGASLPVTFQVRPFLHDLTHLGEN